MTLSSIMVDATIDAYLKRKDKFHFAKLSRKYKEQLRDFFIANLSFKDYQQQTYLKTTTKDTLNEKTAEFVLQFRIRSKESA